MGILHKESRFAVISKALLLSQLGVLSLLGSTIQTSALIVNGDITGGQSSGRYQPADTTLDQLGTNGTHYNLEGPSGSMTLYGTPITACIGVSLVCDPSFVSTRTLTMSVNEFPVSGLLNVDSYYSAAVSFNLSFITDSREPITTYRSSCNYYLQGVCQSWNYGYDSQGYPTFVVTGTESWLKPDGTSIQLTILPSYLQGSWNWDTEGTLLVNARFVAPEPESATLLCVGVAVVAAWIGFNKPKSS